MRIPETLYASITKVLPVVCVDLVIENSKGNFLLVKRANHPLRGEWWVPGGRLLHSEKAIDGAFRKGIEELGVELISLQFSGFFEETFAVDCRGGDIPYHTVSLVYQARLSDSEAISLDRQSTDFTWAKELPEKFVVQRVEEFI